MGGGTGRLPGAILADSSEVLAQPRAAVGSLMSALDTDWIAPDGELLPWSAEAMGLIKEHDASVAAAALGVLAEVLAVLNQAAARDLPVEELVQRMTGRLDNAAAFRDVYVGPEGNCGWRRCRSLPQRSARWPIPGPTSGT